MQSLLSLVFPDKSRQQSHYEGGERNYLKHIQLVLIRNGLSTCNNGAAITHNDFCLSFAWQRQSGRSGTV